ncbi:UNVERIFIED_CONTAM: hypothetical protein Scaly_1362500 [Sesamum calycinum]|uniref:Uncharacterized protein n=3 Tax=Sesamum TaxID=4181 RepID=A0AAE1WYQ1_9LAMI|nr:hypothetical protein Sango_0899900 [Sesamum angolense]
MAAVADVCFEELTKLRAKVGARNPFLSKSCQRDAAEEVKQRKESKKDSSSAILESPAKARSEETMSEATVSLLMDRFAPC